MYVRPNFKTKKALEEAVAAGNKVEVCSPELYPAQLNGNEFIEGPHYPELHQWCAQVRVENGLVTSVK